MTRNVKLCLCLLLALFLTFTVAIGVLADPDTNETSTDSDSSTENGEESSESSESSSDLPSDQHTVSIRGEHVQVYFNGSETPAMQISVDAGSNLTLRVVADEGYQVQRVTMSGLPLPGSAGIYTLGSVDFDCIVTIEVIPDENSSTEDPSDSSDPVDIPLCEVVVTIHGAGSVSVNGTPVESDGSEAVTQSVWVQDTDQSGERAQFSLRPAAGYRLKGLAIDGIDYPNDQLRSDFLSRITERTTVVVTFVPEEEMPSTFPVNISVSEGGLVSVYKQGGTASIDIAANTAETINAEAGSTLTLWVYPVDGYELDALSVDGIAQNTSGGSFKLSNVAKAMNITVKFKAKTVSVNPLGVNDFDWTPDGNGLIHLNLTANDCIGKAVIDKINAQDITGCNYVVLETAYIRWYIPYGTMIEGVTGDSRISSRIEPSSTYNIYLPSAGISFPAGTKVSFRMMALADTYMGGAVELRASDAEPLPEDIANKSLQLIDEGSIASDGWTTPMTFRNSRYQVVVVQSTPEQSDVPSSVPEQTGSLSISSEDEPSGKSYAGLIVALVIAFVAVGGAAALFIVKWRQEKF